MVLHTRHKQIIMAKTKLESSTYPHQDVRQNLADYHQVPIDLVPSTPFTVHFRTQPTDNNKGAALTVGYNRIVKCYRPGIPGSCNLYADCEGTPNDHWSTNGSYPSGFATKSGTLCPAFKTSMNTFDTGGHLHRCTLVDDLTDTSL